MEHFETSIRSYRGVEFVVARKLTARERSDARQKKGSAPLMSKGGALTFLPAKFGNHGGAPIAMFPFQKPSPPHGSESSDRSGDYEAALPTLGHATPIDAPAIVAYSKPDAAFVRQLGFVALSLYGSVEPVPRALGDTVGVRPILPVISSRLNNPVEANLDRYSPTFYPGLLARIWFANKDDAKRLRKELSRSFAGNGAALRGPWLDFDQSLDLLSLHVEILGLATRLRLKAFTDPEVRRLALARATMGKPN